MTSTEDTQDLTLSEAYRYVVRHIGSRPGPAPGWGEAHGKEYGAEVVDSWTGDVMTVHWAASAQLSSLVAETQCAERNGPATAITFPSKLALFIGRASTYGPESAGEVLEDVDYIVKWHLGRVRGLTREPLDVTKLYTPAPEFNQ
jgi:hypothetical protein